MYEDSNVAHHYDKLRIINDIHPICVREKLVHGLLREHLYQTKVRVSANRQCEIHRNIRGSPPSKFGYRHKTDPKSLTIKRPGLQLKVNTFLCCQGLLASLSNSVTVVMR